MSGVVRNGFSTLNRLLGKKNKDSTLSRSTSNLSKSVTNLDASSQHNKIVPLAASTNAPFEQTFRITICLPRDQLYVARVGAKTKLWQLLEMVCTNKLLDKNKFEFRHPSDSSQVYSNDLTIGEVGLNEIRLSLKTDSHHEPYPKFHTDEIVKLRQNSRESLSSSEFSKNSSRQYIKTTSPYSSTNSLSSMDSTGLNSRHHPPIAPSRKKRIAPRPPSQSSLSERSDVNGGEHVFKQPQPVMPPKNFFVSSPNLTNNTDTKGNKQHEASDKKIHRIEEQEIEKKPTPRPTSLHGLRQISVQSNGDNRATYAAPSPTVTPVTPAIVDASTTVNDSLEFKDERPEPVPRKRTVLGGKKKAPSPPPRGLPPVAPPRSVSKVDLTEPINDTPATPNPNVSKVMLNVNSDTEVEPIQEPKETLVRSTAKSPPPPTTPLKSSETPVGSPQTETKLIANDDDALSQEIETDLSSTNRTDSSDEEETKVYNIQMGKSLVVEKTQRHIEDVEVVENIKNENKEVIENTQQHVKINGTENESVLLNKHLDNARETTPSPRSESPLWSYTLPAPSTFADDKNSEIRDDSDRKDGSDVNGDLSSEVSDVSDVPIKAFIQKRVPVDFHALDDKSNAESSMTSDIEDGYQGDKARFSRGALLQSLENHRDEFIENEFEFLEKLEDDDKQVVIKKDVPTINGSTNDTDYIPIRKQDVISELNNVIVNNQLETVIRRSETPDDIESAQKSSLSNFIIQTYTNHVDVKTDSPVEEKIDQPIKSSVDEINKSAASTEDINKSDDEIVLRPKTEYIQSKRPSLSNGNLFKSPRVSRSDSFHSTRNGSTENLGLTSRSSSYVSLVGNQSNKATPRNSLTNGSLIDSNRRKSSSELSIADSPSLQSLLVMKTILSNSRKNSLNVDSLSNGSKENGELDGDSESKKGSVEIEAKSPVPAPVYDDSSKENSPQNKLPTKLDEADNPKWKYQGPPAINLGTWGERPKSMIAIKNDNDYIFGGTINPSDTVATPSESPMVSAKTISNPLSVVVETPVKSVDVTDNVDVPDNHLPIVRAVVKKVQPVANVPTDASRNIEIRRPSYEVTTIVTEKVKPEPRAPLQNRFSWKIPATFNQPISGHNNNFDKKVPTVRGFKAPADAMSDKDQSIDSGYKSLSPTVVLINSSKDPPAERPKTQPPPTVAKRPSLLRQQKSEEPSAVPFSQFTLRKTGLKEKIVAMDADNNESKSQPTVISPPIQTIQLRQKQEINIRPVTIHATTTRITVAQEPIKPAATVEPSVQPTQKLAVENIRPVVSNGTTVTKATIPIPNEPVKRSVIVSSPIQNVQLRPKQDTQKVRPITVHTTVPPPPPPSIVKQVPIVRGVIKQKSLPSTADPRDALLDAIKNFNKGNLKKK
ncbi:uncharacterized protein LOC119077839 isoform X2 [Bradysia coprophila]|uniref:uncharacterized protein LOC119077839 isoform X2 n=1 Tax=Bradysia coprophila TaxID=38358 RepID=UPI00187D978F|nr:uncharacterized protein LOC119077839 isoform X2 [Bradysia coprophila]